MLLLASSTPPNQPPSFPTPSCTHATCHQLQLAEAGKALETGEVKGAARVMNEDWVKDFSKATKKVGRRADRCGRRGG